MTAIEAREHAFGEFHVELHSGLSLIAAPPSSSSRAFLQRWQAAVHAAWGCVVTLTCSTRRRPSDREQRTETGTLRVSTPEATALDLVRYAENLGGLSAVAAVLSELAERLDPNRLAEAAGSSCRSSSAPGTCSTARRERQDQAARRLGRGAATAPGPSSRRAGSAPGPADERWSVLENEPVEVEP